MKNPRVGMVLVFLSLLVGSGIYYSRRPNPHDVHLAAAREAEARFDFDDALNHLGRYARTRPNHPESRLELARLARRGGDYDRARQEMLEYEGLAGTTPAGKLEHELLQAQLGQLDAVEKTLVQQVEAGHPDADAIREALMRGQIRVYRLPSAMYWAEQLLERHPHHVPALLAQGMMFESVGNTDAAITSYETALANYPHHFQARLNLGEVLLRINRPLEAQPHFVALYGQNKINPDVALGYARSLHALGDNLPAATVVDQLFLHQPAHPHAHALRGRIALDLNDLPAAERHLQQAIAKLPADREIHMTLASCLRQLDKTQEADQVLNRAKQIDADLKLLAAASDRAVNAPSDPKPKHDAGVICLRNGQHGQAVRWFSGALQIDPKYKPTHTALATYYTSIGSIDLADKHRRLAELAAGPASP